MDEMIAIGKEVWLELKEVRGTSTTFTNKDGFDDVEIESHTRTHFQWRLRGIASKIDPTIASKDELKNNQEIYYVTISSANFDVGCMISGFKSREAAIRNALEFAKRNKLKVDGYNCHSSCSPPLDE